MLLATIPALKLAAVLTAASMAFASATAQQSGPPPRLRPEQAVSEARPLPVAPTLPRSSRQSTGHDLLDFRYRPYDSGTASTAAHPAYETAGTVAGGSYAFGHVGARRVGH